PSSHGAMRSVRSEPLGVFRLDGLERRPKWAWFLAVEAIDEDVEVDVPAAGDVQHRRTIGKAAVRQHQQNVAAAWNELEGDLRVMPGAFTPREAQQARGVAGCNVAGEGGGLAILLESLRRRLAVRGEVGVAERQLHVPPDTQVHGA